jgi:hypothetical protein
VYDVAQFKKDMKRLAAKVPSLTEWKRLPTNLPGWFKVLRRSGEEMPPNEDQVMGAAIGSAMAASAVTILSCAPESAPVVALAALCGRRTAYQELFTERDDQTYHSAAKRARRDGHTTWEEGARRLRWTRWSVLPHSSWS